MKQDLKMKTVLIIWKDYEYLVGLDISGRLKWSTSPWDAWSTRNPRKALLVARKTGGEIYLFNPVVAQIQKLEGSVSTR